MWMEKGEVLFVLGGTPLRGMGEVDSEVGRKMKKRARVSAIPSTDSAMKGSIFAGYMTNHTVHHRTGYGPLFWWHLYTHVLPCRM